MSSLCQHCFKECNQGDHRPATRARVSESDCFWKEKFPSDLEFIHMDRL